MLPSLVILVMAAVACTRNAPVGGSPWAMQNGTPVELPEEFTIYGTAALQVIAQQDAPRYTPTPDAPHEIPDVRTDPDQYEVQSGDTLGTIALKFNVTVEQIASANELEDINVLSIGQRLVIPVATPTGDGLGLKIIPDSELVRGPGTLTFNIAEFVNSQPGYLARHEEDVDGRMMTGIQIVTEIAQDYSVNPRLLLAVIEYQSNWLTNPNPRTVSMQYPLGREDTNREGLYKQLAWAANELNRGYYQWRVGAVATWSLTDGSVIPIIRTINAGTAGVQNFFAKLYGRETWEKIVNEQGFIVTYEELFGYPFRYSIEPVLPDGLAQPELQLPFESGLDWAFTGGPHGSWGDGSAWGALDFAPPSDVLGCTPSDDWVVAMTSGTIVRAGNGAVIQDLDNDGLEQTGWALLYMHIETRDRVAVGTYLEAGDHIGHPSCEGGYSTGTHVHVARRYNGEWIPADQDDMRFDLDGWTSSGTGVEYDGYMTRGSVTIEAQNGRSPENAIRR